MHEEREDDDDRERDPEQPKKRTATEAHGHLLFLRLSWPINTGARLRFPGTEVTAAALIRRAASVSRMRKYRFVYRNKKRNEGDPVFEFPDDRTAEEEARRALADLLRDVVLDGSPIEEEAIDVVGEDERVVARVSSADDRK